MDDTLSKEQLSELRLLAIDAARAPSELILSGFRSDGLTTERKADGSPVTTFDREAERIIRAYLGKHQPRKWPVLGEELGGGTEPSTHRWVLDPIDGTLPFSRGLPTFGTLLALEETATRRTLLGVIHLPAMGETYSAALGLGAWCGDQRLRVAPSRQWGDCIISVPSEYHFRLAGVAESHEQLRAQAPHLRCYSDCWAYAMVARGAIDALAEFNLSRWDIAAPEIIVAEAGGLVLVRDVHGEPGKYDAILGSPQVTEEFAQLLQFHH